jgi:hypothetical protein
MIFDATLVVASMVFLKGRDEVNRKVRRKFVAPMGRARSKRKKQSVFSEFLAVIIAVRSVLLTLCKY